MQSLHQMINWMHNGEATFLYPSICSSS